MFRKKSIRFQGSIERLHRMVGRYQGKFLGDREFVLLWYPAYYKKRKQWHRLTFQIRCCYEKEDGLFWITYRIIPTLFSGLRMLLPLGFWAWGAVCLWDPEEPAGTIAATLLAAWFMLLNYWQLRDSEKEFLQRFTAVTK